MTFVIALPRGWHDFMLKDKSSLNSKLKTTFKSFQNLLQLYEFLDLVVVRKILIFFVVMKIYDENSKR